MPLVFKNQKRKPVTIEKDGSVFFFDLSKGRQRQVRLNMFLGGDRDPGALITEAFRKALYAWENVQDESGNPVEFSVEVRDALIDQTDTFTEDDMFTVLDIGEGAKKNEDSTSTNA